MTCFDIWFRTFVINGKRKRWTDWHGRLMLYVTSLIIKRRIIRLRMPLNRHYPSICHSEVVLETWKLICIFIIYRHWNGTCSWVSSLWKMSRLFRLIRAGDERSHGFDQVIQEYSGSMTRSLNMLWLYVSGVMHVLHRSDCQQLIKYFSLLYFYYHILNSF